MKVIIPGVVAGIATAALVSLAPAANADSGQTVMIRPGDFVQALSDTRSAGHVDFLKEGLHVKTDDTTSNSKAAEYFSVPTQGLPSSASLTWFGTDAQPGSQIVFDANGATDGDAYNVLVGEPAYNGEYWLTKASSATAKLAAPSCDGTAVVATETSDDLIAEGHCTGGNGSAWHGTLGQWQAALPAAQVGAVGFSLGSGVKGDGVIHDIQVGDTDYQFTNEPATTTVDVTGEATASLGVKRDAQVLKVRIATDALGANQVQGRKLGFRITDDSDVAFHAKLGAGQKAAVNLRFADGTGRHKVVIHKGGEVDQTFVIKTGT